MALCRLRTKDLEVNRGNLIGGARWPGKSFTWKMPQGQEFRPSIAVCHWGAPGLSLVSFLTRLVVVCFLTHPATLALSPPMPCSRRHTERYSTSLARNSALCESL